MCADLFNAVGINVVSGSSVYDVGEMFGCSVNVVKVVNVKVGECVLCFCCLVVSVSRDGHDYF